MIPALGIDQRNDPSSLESEREKGRLPIGLAGILGDQHEAVKDLLRADQIEPVLGEVALTLRLVPDDYGVSLDTDGWIDKAAVDPGPSSLIVVYRQAPVDSRRSDEVCVAQRIHLLEGLAHTVTRQPAGRVKVTNRDDPDVDRWGKRISGFSLGVPPIPMHLASLMILSHAR